ncbi:predicted protein [Naegleria gruberi]|uniref:Predicted protein n=1 Tax=Naegleria gruberi TaxID=5762 RepID=D2V7Q6_NAEGR|nr:uncharacterized protein NAEGRDRAFT_31862 [Naegleria gruberi]EFC46914.1 predicted protein [Naegleria gruberi]|eukprot:XP_002679658.1 predicted protein [Naegleria gruberi strain NEG-M]
MDDLVFNLKFTSKQFQRASKKAEKEEKKEKDKVKQAMEKGNLEGARIHAQTAIRKKNETINFLRLSSRIDAVASRMDTAIKMNRVTSTMGGIVKGMDKVLGAMDASKIGAILDKFEQQFEDLDVTSQYMESSMQQTTSLSTPEDEVNQLMAEVADENGLNVSEKLGAVKTKKDDIQSVQVDELSERLSKLKSQKL